MKKILHILFLIFSYSLYGQDISHQETDYLYLIRDNLVSDKCGYINSKGDTVIPFDKYTICYMDIIKQFGIVLLNEKGFVGIDNKDSILFNIFPYDNGPDEPSEGLFRIIKNGKIGYANLKGQIIIEPQFDCAESFKKGIAKVSDDCDEVKDGEHSSWMSDRWYFIDSSGIKIKEKYEYNCPVYYIDFSLNKLIYSSADSISFEDITQRFLSEIISSLKIESMPDPIDTKGEISFIINTNGNVIKPHIDNSISVDIDKQIIELMKKWGKLPIGYCEGNPVPVIIMIPYQIDYE
jgi:hypothetical protein